MDPPREVTVTVPTNLLKKAQKISNAGVSETVRKGLQAIVEVGLR